MFMSIFRKENHKLSYSPLGNLSCLRLHTALLQLSILLQQLNYCSTENKIQANIAPLASYRAESTEILHWNPRIDLFSSVPTVTHFTKALLAIKPPALALFDTGVYMFQVVSDFMQRLRSSWIPLSCAWFLGLQNIEQKPVMMCRQKQTHPNCIITRALGLKETRTGRGNDGTINPRKHFLARWKGDVPWNP